jgi:hypothetical protein
MALHLSEYIFDAIQLSPKQKMQPSGRIFGKHMRGPYHRPHARLM